MVSLRLWSVIKMLIPFSERLCSTLFISSIAKGSIPANGSSKRINLGFEARHLAISTFRLCPPDKTYPNESSISSNQILS